MNMMISYQELVRTFPNFQLSFSLPEHAQINQAQLDSGILKIAIHQEIPESEKPRKIAIENQGRVIEHKV